MQIQKVNLNSNPNKLMSFGHRTVFPISINDDVKATFYEPDRKVVGYEVKVKPNASLYIERDQETRKIVARVSEGKVDVNKLPQTIGEYYRGAVRAAARHFVKGIKIRF